MPDLIFKQPRLFSPADFPTLIPAGRSQVSAVTLPAPGVGAITAQGAAQASASLPGQIAFNDQSTFVMFWARVDSWTASNEPIGVSRDAFPTQSGWIIQRNGTSTTQINCVMRNATDLIATGSLTAGDGRWHHFAALFVVGAAFQWWIDGVAQSASAGTVTSTLNSVQNLGFGITAGPGTSVADCAVWNAIGGLPHVLLAYRRRLPAYKIGLPNLRFYAPCNNSEEIANWADGSETLNQPLFVGARTGPGILHVYGTQRKIGRAHV